MRRSRTRYAEGSLNKHSTVIFKLCQSRTRENIPSHAPVNGIPSRCRRRGISPSFHFVTRKWQGILLEILSNNASVTFCRPKQKALGMITSGRTHSVRPLTADEQLLFAASIQPSAPAMLFIRSDTPQSESDLRTTHLFNGTAANTKSPVINPDLSVASSRVFRTR